jgi:hypothetical protein
MNETPLTREPTNQETGDVWSVAEHKGMVWMRNAEEAITDAIDCQSPDEPRPSGISVSDPNPTSELRQLAPATRTGAADSGRLISIGMMNKSKRGKSQKPLSPYLPRNSSPHRQRSRC